VGDDHRLHGGRRRLLRKARMADHEDGFMIFPKLLFWTLILGLINGQGAPVYFDREMASFVLESVCEREPWLIEHLHYGCNHRDPEIRWRTWKILRRMIRCVRCDGKGAKFHEYGKKGVDYHSYWEGCYPCKQSGIDLAKLRKIRWLGRAA
jgi:hypothetical protein